MDGFGQVRESSPYLPHSAAAGGQPLNSPCHGATFTIFKEKDNIVTASLSPGTSYLKQYRGILFDDEQSLSQPSSGSRLAIRQHGVPFYAHQSRSYAAPAILQH